MVIEEPEANQLAEATPWEPAENREARSQSCARRGAPHEYRWAYMTAAEKEEEPALLVRLLLRGSLVLCVAVFLPIGSLLLLMIEERVEKRPLILLSVLLSCVLLAVILIFRAAHKKQAQELSGALVEASRSAAARTAAAEKIGGLEQSLAAAQSEIVAKNAQIQKLEAANESWRRQFEEGSSGGWGDDDGYSTPPSGADPQSR